MGLDREEDIADLYRLCIRIFFQSSLVLHKHRTSGKDLLAKAGAIVRSLSFRRWGARNQNPTLRPYLLNRQEAVQLFKKHTKARYDHAVGCQRHGEGGCAAANTAVRAAAPRRSQKVSPWRACDVLVFFLPRPNSSPPSRVLRHHSLSA